MPALISDLLPGEANILRRESIAEGDGHGVIGAAQALFVLDSPRVRGHHCRGSARGGAKTTAFAGLALGFAIWFGGFMVAGGQWFASWQSNEWNGREAAFMFYTPIALVFLILLHKA
jgi:hypothetical protein